MEGEEKTATSPQSDGGGEQTIAADAAVDAAGDAGGGRGAEGEEDIVAIVEEACRRQTRLLAGQNTAGASFADAGKVVFAFACVCTCHIVRCSATLSVLSLIPPKPGFVSFFFSRTDIGTVHQRTRFLAGVSGNRGDAR